jgi:hypothetical protein
MKFIGGQKLTIVNNVGSEASEAIRTAESRGFRIFQQKIV